MGNSDSKLVFKEGIFKLSQSRAIPADDVYWTGVRMSHQSVGETTDRRQFWKLPESAEDVFSLFTTTDVRRTRDNSLYNIETLLTAVVSRLVALRHLLAFPDQDLAPGKEALNCVRIITRILPFLYEAEQLEPWEDKFFWQRTKKHSKNEPHTTPEVLFDGSNSTGLEEKEDEEKDETIEYRRPLGEELIDTLIDLLFFVGFTLPHVERSKNKVTYAIWQNGVGCVTPMQSTKEIENNRTEILRLLLTLSSKSLYMPARTYKAIFQTQSLGHSFVSDLVPAKGVKALTYITTCPDKQIVLSLLCSQLNTVGIRSPSM